MLKILFFTLSFLILKPYCFYTIWNPIKLIFSTPLVHSWTSLYSVLILKWSPKWASHWCCALTVLIITLHMHGNDLMRLFIFLLGLTSQGPHMIKQTPHTIRMDYIHCWTEAFFLTLFVLCCLVWDLRIYTSLILIRLGFGVYSILNELLPWGSRPHSYQAKPLSYITLHEVALTLFDNHMTIAFSISLRHPFLVLKPLSLRP